MVCGWCVCGVCVVGGVCGVLGGVWVVCGWYVGGVWVVWVGEWMSVGGRGWAGGGVHGLGERGAECRDDGEGARTGRHAVGEISAARRDAPEAGKPVDEQHDSDEHLSRGVRKTRRARGARVVRV